MNSEIHDQPDAEIAYRCFRSEFSDWFDSLDENQKNFYWDDAPDKKIDPRVNYPLDLTHAMVDTALGGAPASSDPMARVAQLLHAFGNYAKVRTIYTIDRTLFSHLVRAKWPDDIPISAAALPKNGCVLDLPAHEVFGSQNIQDCHRVQIICTYDMNGETGDLDIVLTALGINRNHEGKPLMSLDELNAWISVVSNNLADAILDYAIYMEGAPERVKQWVENRFVVWSEIPDERDAEIRETRIFSKEWLRYLKAILSVLLYINGNDDLLELNSSNTVPMNKSARRRLTKEKSNRTSIEAPLRVFRVGGKYASTIQRWEESESVEAKSTGRSPRPHLRAAHAHTYRIGKGRTGIRVRFLPPIPVKGWEAPEAVPSNRLVR